MFLFQNIKNINLFKNCKNIKKTNEVLKFDKLK